MAEQRRANGSETSDVQSIAEIIARSESDILEKWMLALKSKITLREDLLAEDDLRRRSAEFLRSLKVGLRQGDVADVDADAWQPLKSLLGDIFAAHAAHGVSPSEGAFYVFSLKDTLVEFFRKDFTDRPASFQGQLDSLTHLLENLGLFAFETISRRHEEQLGRVKGRESPATGDHSDMPDSTQLLQTLTAFKKGDFSARMPVDQIGVAGKIADTLNDIIELEERTVQEFEQISTAVGREGSLKQRLSLGALPGSWGTLVNSANTLIEGLVQPIGEVTRVVRAVADGDLSQSIALETEVGPLKGEFLSTAKVINTMVEQLTTFASEVTRVAREVGTEGKLGGQATVEGVSGTWRDLTDTVNTMAGSLTDQIRNVAEVTAAVANGDLTRKITIEAKGEVLKLKDTINTMVDQLTAFASEVTRVAREVGTEGQLGGQATVEGVSGVWKDLTENVNTMARNLTDQVRNIAEVTTAVANGDLTRKVTAEVRGELLELKNTINTMVDRLSTFSTEVTRIARQIGVEGELGGQAEVIGVSGTWRDLTESVNLMASNLTDQVRGVAKVVTAVAEGDLKKKVTAQARGEVGMLSETINGMTDTLSTFADEVTRVAREVGVEGVLGGQANVPGAAGTWKDLTGNVNEMASNLTTQVRAIGEVATAVTKGDLSRSITVEAAGEVAQLKDNINQMIGTLGETTKTNEQQDWLKSNLAKFTNMLQGQRDMVSVANMILSELAPMVSAQHSVFYSLEAPEGQTDKELKLLGTYGFKERKQLANRFKLGEGLIGQAAMEKKRILLTEVPSDYVQISSGLGAATPLNIVVLPVLFENELQAIIELASFNRYSEIQLTFLEQLTETLGIVLTNIAASARTEQLLEESQTMSEELQTQQEELQQSNEELEEKAKQLTEQNVEVEEKNREVEEAKLTLQEKAEQLSLTSKYKSEFLANMSHELRTPLNSLMILSNTLSDNADGNLTDKQVEYAQTIHGSGTDLLELINEILDLSKIESGTMAVELSDVPFNDLQGFVERTFRQVAEDRGLDFEVDLMADLPRAIHTDAKRLQQVLKNLLSNAFKFTEKGQVDLRISTARQGWSRDHETLDRASGVIAFTVSDTGIGIPKDKQKVIFEAFQQADGGSSRKFGGTGLGLSISREIARLLGGEIRVESAPGKGSTFTLYVPQGYTPPPKTAPLPQNPVEGPPQRLIRDSQSTGAGPAAGEPDLTSLVPGGLPDDRDNIQPGDHVVLIVEDDVKFARILLDMAHDKGFKRLVATRGDAGLALARKYNPDAITLDIRLPEMDGWRVLDQLKHEPATRHIPVHMISVEDGRQRALQQGAIAYLEKPVDEAALAKAFGDIGEFVEQRVKKLLIVEDDETQRQAIVELIGNSDVEATAVGTGHAALTAMKSQAFDCLVLDLGLPDMSGFELIEAIKRAPDIREIPVIVYTGKELTEQEETKLRHVAESIIVKDVKSPERLLDETALFLHRVEENLPERKRKMLRQVHQQDPALTGKKILVVDDDMRNIFAVTSVLERQKMEVVYAETGQAGLQMLKDTPDVDVVLMDIMMPGMDGYAAMRAIRKMPQFKNLPIIAVTAKAMKGDREKCIEAGASDYIKKPVDTEQLLSLLRVWTYG